MHSLFFLLRWQEVTGVPETEKAEEVTPQVLDGAAPWQRTFQVPTTAKALVASALPSTPDPYVLSLSCRGRMTSPNGIEIRGPACAD